MSPLERSVEIMNTVLTHLKENRENLRYIYNMKWCLDIVNKKKLYEAITLVSANQGNSH